MPNVRKLKISNTSYDIEDTNARSQLSAKENLSNKSTEISSSSTDAQYPTAKAVYDAVDESKISANVSGTILQIGNLKPLSGAYDIVATENADGTQNLAITDASGSATLAADLIITDVTDTNSFYWSAYDLVNGICVWNRRYINSYPTTLSLHVGDIVNCEYSQSDQFDINNVQLLSSLDFNNYSVWRIIGENPTIEITCFIAGMGVKMADGLYKSIETVQIGDTVIGYDGTNYTECTVINIFKHKYSGKIYKIFYGDNSFEATWSHPIYIEGEYKKVVDLRVGDKVLVNGNNIPIKDIEIYEVENIDVYNLDVNNSNNYIVENCLVHNKKS